MSYCQNTQLQYEHVRRLTALFEEAHRKFLEGTGELSEMKKRKEEVENVVADLKKILDEPYFYSGSLRGVVEKRNYRVAERISVDGRIQDLSIFPDGRMVIKKQTNVGSSQVLEEIIEYKKDQWKSHAGKTVFTDPYIKHFRTSFEGKYIFVGEGYDIHVLMRGPHGTWLTKKLEGHASGIELIQMLSDGRIISFDFSGNVRIWTEGENGSWCAVVLKDGGGLSNCPRVFSDGRLIFFDHRSRSLEVWKFSEGHWKPQYIDVRDIKIETLRPFPDGTLLSVDNHIILRIWIESAEGMCYSEKLEISDDTIRKVDIFPDGKILVAGDQSLCVWKKNKDGNWQSETLMEYTSFHIDSIQALPDGRAILLSSPVNNWHEKTMTIFTRTSGGQWISEVLPDGEFGCVFRVLPDGRIVSGGDGGKIHIWDGDVVHR